MQNESRYLKHVIIMRQDKKHGNKSSMETKTRSDGARCGPLGGRHGDAARMNLASSEKKRVEETCNR
jgi:hypothetical protein